MKRLNLNDHNVFNKWRELYDELTDQEQQDFANECEERFPSQVHHDRSNFDFLFSTLRGTNPNGFKVVEVGGWKGELAKYCLEKYSYLIRDWTNIEFCENAVEKTVEISQRYEAVNPKTFTWFNKGKLTGYDVFVSAHTIEHLSDDHMAQLIKALSGIPVVMFDAPLSLEGEDWNDFLGTHKLKMGWNKVNGLMIREGYTSEQVNKGCYIYRKLG